MRYDELRTPAPVGERHRKVERWELNCQSVRERNVGEQKQNEAAKGVKNSVYRVLNLGFMMSDRKVMIGECVMVSQNRQLHFIVLNTDLFEGSNNCKYTRCVATS